jgi:hypothetical protein
MCTMVPIKSSVLDGRDTADILLVSDSDEEIGIGMFVEWATRTVQFRLTFNS